MTAVGQLRNYYLDVLRLPPAESEKKGQHSIISLALAAAAVGEVALCSIIIARVSYTEIDWKAYMQQVQSFLDGERNYENIKGGTGPLVYPAGFLYFFSLLSWLTEGGKDVLLAQIFFMGLYITLIMLVFNAYRSAAGRFAPLWTFLLLCVSKRVHSIFVLRLFNDGVAVWIFFAALHFFLQRRWHVGCLLYSVAVGVKMNVLLFAPGLLLLLWQGAGFLGTVSCLAICAGVQLLLGFPFLKEYPVEYVTRAFDLGRIFQYKWTVNLKFLSEEQFASPELAIGLLVATTATLVIFAQRWLAAEHTRMKNGQLSPEYIAKTLFTSNFIGIVFARTLHYQFYTWYFFTLPFLVWSVQLPKWTRLLLLAGIEYSFNRYPATPESSAILQVCHLVLLVALWWSPVMASTQVAAKRKSL